MTIRYPAGAKYTCCIYRFTVAKGLLVPVASRRAPSIPVDIGPCWAVPTLYRRRGVPSTKAMIRPESHAVPNALLT